MSEKKVKLEVGRPVGKLLQHCLQEKMKAKQMESQEQWRDILVMVTELGQQRIMYFHLFKDIFGSVCIFFLYVIISQFVEISAVAASMSLQLCPTLCDPIDGSPPGSPVPGIIQARILEWVAISFSNA